MTLKTGALFAGYGGLDLAIEEAFGAELAWYAEYDAAPSKIMAHHWPDLTNYGDVTAVDWAKIPPVDIISGGSPCQDLSLAGARKGMTAGTRSNLWESMREAIATIQPTYVVWENVRGALSAKAVSASDLEPGQGPMGDRNDGHLRALGRVLGDLASLGYDCQWRGLRAADVGAPHGRFRIFILAKRRGATADANNRGRAQGDDGDQRQGPVSGRTPAVPYESDRGPHGGCKAIADALRGGSRRRSSEPGKSRRNYALIGSGTRGSWARAATANTSGVRTRIHVGTGRQGWEQAGTRRPTLVPPANRPPAAKRPGTGNGEPSAVNWGPYATAIRRWETVRGTAPSPTELTAKGKHRLSAAFAEWLMGVDAGWITDVPGISRNDMLKAAGNGVVPQQAAAALRDMLAAFELEAAE